jgi:hypothetical protein
MIVINSVREGLGIKFGRARRIKLCVAPSLNLLRTRASAPSGKPVEACGELYMMARSALFDKFGGPLLDGQNQHSGQTALGSSRVKCKKTTPPLPVLFSGQNISPRR